MEGKILPGYPSDHDMFPLLTEESGALREGIVVFPGELYQAYLKTVDSEWKEHRPKTKSYSTDPDEINQIVKDHRLAAGEIYPQIDNLLEQYLGSGQADSFPLEDVPLVNFKGKTTRRHLEETYEDEPEMVEETWSSDTRIAFSYFKYAYESLKDLTGKGDGSALWRMANRCTPPMPLGQVILLSLKRMSPFFISAAIALTGWKLSSYLIQTTRGGDGLLDVLLIGAGQLAMFLGGLLSLWNFLDRVLMNLGNIFADFSACIHRAQREKDLENSRRLLYSRYRFCVLWSQALNRRKWATTFFAPDLLNRLEELLGISS